MKKTGMQDKIYRWQVLDVGDESLTVTNQHRISLMAMTRSQRCKQHFGHLKVWDSNSLLEWIDGQMNILFSTIPNCCGDESDEVCLSLKYQIRGWIV